MHDTQQPFYKNECYMHIPRSKRNSHHSTLRRYHAEGYTFHPLIHGILFAGVFFLAFFSIGFVIEGNNADIDSIKYPFSRKETSPVFYNEKHFDKETLRTFILLLQRLRDNALTHQPLFSIQFFTPLNPKDIKGLLIPIQGASLQLDNVTMLPNSSREYRNGVHEGIDFPGNIGTTVLASYDGIVIRADKNYEEVTWEKNQMLLTRSFLHDRTPRDVLDSFRGRQIWINHGNGVITRYCHLDSIHNDIYIGKHIHRGDSVGTVGRSGLKWTSFGTHLHLEIRIGDGYLGNASSEKELKMLYSKAFAPR